jgi:hypothetical protein
MTQADRETRRRRVGAALALIAVIGAVALAGCGSSSSNSGGGAGASTTQISHAKTKFVLHAGLAFGAFHHWIYKPLKAGEFSHPFSHKLAIVKAALAAGFVYHELKLALQDAQADPTLSKLVAPITALQARIRSLGSSIRSGSPSASDAERANGAISSIGHGSASAGQPITEQVPSSL